MNVAFYCMSSDVYFLGAVAMINSLRLQGHEQPIYLLDLGLKPEQRELLAPQVSFVEAPADVAPWLAKTVAPLRHPADVMVLIDADMIVTRPLDELIEAAAEGRVVAFENDVDRFVPEWGEILGLGELQRQPYLCSGLVAMGRELGEQVLGLMDDRQRKVDFEQSFFGRNVTDYPLLYLDQDVLNAILASRDVDRERVVALDYRLAPMPPFAGLRVTYEQTLRCAYPDEAEPFVVHHFGAKPWVDRLDHGVYSKLLRRALVDPGAAIAVPRAQIPRRLRTGPVPRVERASINLRYWLRWHLIDPGRALIRRLRSRLSRRPPPEPAGTRLLRRFAEAYPDAVFVEVGSNDGRSFDPLHEYVRSRQWRGVMVEPIPHVFARLRETYAGIDRVALENSAIADRDGHMVLYHLAEAAPGERAGLPDWYDAVASVSRERVIAQSSSIPDADRRVVGLEVPCLTFESLCAKHDLSELDLLLVDTEGHDRAVIEGVDFDRHRPRLIVYEHLHLSYADRRECRAKLEALGYETMEEGFDTYCLDPGADPALTRFWRELSPVIPGASQREWETFAGAGVSAGDWETFRRSTTGGDRP